VRTGGVGFTIEHLIEDIELLRRETRATPEQRG